MKKYIILMQMWLACAVLMTACSDLDEQVEQLMVQKEQTETIAPNETDKSVAETKTVEYTNVQTIALTTHGTLKEQLGDNLTTTDKLILSGPIDATDVDVFRNQMTALKAIDMTDVTFVESDATYTYHSSGYTASLKVGIIPEAMFGGLDNFVEIKLPKEVIHLEGWTFYHCSSLQTIELPENLETLGERSTFDYCSSLTTIVIPEKIEMIPENCFRECSSLQSVSLPDNLYGIGKSAFSLCSALSSIELPKKMVYIGAYAFYNCSSLESITIPASVTSLGKGNYDRSEAFAYCSNLSTIILEEGLTVLGSHMFGGCTALKQIEIPSSIKEISELTFSSCSALEKVVINQGVEKIGESAFSNCGSLATIDLPEGLLEIDAYAFDGCFFSVIDFLPNSLIKIGVRAFRNNKKLFTVVLPFNIEYLESCIFEDCVSLKEVVLPKNLKEIRSSAFAHTAIETITFPETLTMLGDRAFVSCKSLKELVFPAGLTEIAEYTCYECSALERVVISEGTTMIGTNAFMDTHALTEVTLPSTMKVIGGGAFQNAGVTSLSFLPDGIETIDSYAFRGCPIKDKVITLPSITSIGYYAFENNKTIGAIYISGSQDVVLDDIFGKASNCLIYVTGKVTLPTNEHIYNKITNGNCLKLRLVENSPWYCPEPFNAGIVTLTKQFNQKSYSTNSPSYAVSGKASNWYAFNMPFVPDEITSADGRTWAPFNAEVEGAKPFWLRKLTTDSKKPFVDVTEIEADVPYIISFPCNENYDAEYNLCGDITFTATNITIPKTGDQIVLSGPYYSMYSSYEPIPQASSVYLLNSAHYEPNGVRKNYEDIWGSAFEQSLRESWSWEPYISFSSPTTTKSISLDGASTRGHKEVGSIPSIDDM